MLGISVSNAITPMIAAGITTKISTVCQTVTTCTVTDRAVIRFTGQCRVGFVSVLRRGLARGSRQPSRAPRSPRSITRNPRCQAFSTREKPEFEFPLLDGNRNGPPASPNIRPPRNNVTPRHAASRWVSRQACPAQITRSEHPLGRMSPPQMAANGRHLGVLWTDTKVRSFSPVRPLRTTDWVVFWQLAPRRATLCTRS